MRSSYKQNNYGNVLTALVLGKRPEFCIELGVLDGYSTTHIGLALQFNREAFGINGCLYCWDLWDQYEYKHGDKEKVQKILDYNKLTPFVKLHDGDAFEVPHFIQADSVDFLHVDISNDGNTLKKVMQFWSHRMKPDGMIVFEGGSSERDNVEWMTKYNKSPILEELKTNETIKKEFNFIVFSHFPSMTVLQKKGNFSK
jgi:predicted O-methyltransferase YrrM